MAKKYARIENLAYVLIALREPQNGYGPYQIGLVSFKSGKVLSAYFYLRTFIEQFARRITVINDKTTGTEIMDKYAKTAPEKIRGDMPSLKEWYDKLSEKLHGAIEDADTFTCAVAEINRHFEFRKLYKLPK